MQKQVVRANKSFPSSVSPSHLFFNSPNPPLSFNYTETWNKVKARHVHHLWLLPVDCNCPDGIKHQMMGPGRRTRESGACRPEFRSQQPGNSQGEPVTPVTKEGDQDCLGLLAASPEWKMWVHGQAKTPPQRNMRVRESYCIIAFL